ncbi:hypothetical protein PR048_029694 [Dryococelus australis]|uniref:Uncharacterized protein n=1 Tax=Dryococelus australis TaxID=614101 RepID=A0ABQ9GFZ8_9NEOP|nr:hypothetical protein PR048_029694 [Dryococelus australis]
MRPSAHEQAGKHLGVPLTPGVPRTLHPPSQNRIEAPMELSLSDLGRLRPAEGLKGVITTPTAATGKLTPGLEFLMCPHQPVLVQTSSDYTADHSRRDHQQPQQFYSHRHHK